MAPQISQITKCETFFWSVLKLVGSTRRAIDHQKLFDLDTPVRVTHVRTERLIAAEAYSTTYDGELFNPHGSPMAQAAAPNQVTEPDMPRLRARRWEQSAFVKASRIWTAAGLNSV